MAFDAQTKLFSRTYRFVGSADAEPGDVITPEQHDTAIDEVVTGINALFTALQTDIATLTLDHSISESNGEYELYDPFITLNRVDWLGDVS